jgi:hypothetical protein
MADRQYVQAARNHSRSVELNPANKNGRRKLRESKTLMAVQLTRWV